MPLRPNYYTVNIIIFACMRFWEVAKIENFLCNYLCFLLPLYGIMQVTFMMYIFSWIFENCK